MAARAATAVVLTSRGGATVPATGRRILLFGQGVVSSSGTSLALALGSGTCDTDVTARVPEVTVALASPVGVRAVIDAASGRPLLPRAAEG